MVKLRDYQQKAIDLLYAWFETHTAGNPCIVMPTGSGKSHVIAALCVNAVQSWPETRILMATHRKELIEQDAEKLLVHWPGAPVGVYSAGMGRREIESITFAGIQSIYGRIEDIGFIDLVIIDEAHLVAHRDEGMYRDLLRGLSEINPALRVIGLTATPYRLGHGLITDPPALFHGLIEPISIEDLVRQGYLAPLRSKVTLTKLDVTGVHKRGGEFIESELIKAVNQDPVTAGVIDDIIARAGDRRAWLLFCTGVAHAQRTAEMLRDRGITAQCVLGTTPMHERETILEDFKTGRIRALTNANVLTTGFDYPDIDLIAMLRPTMSPGLYVQMAGRGMRPKSHTDHCLVLDFAGVVEMHGPITNVQVPGRAGDGNDEAPVKICDECGELVSIATMICPACGTSFPPPVKKRPVLHNDDIMGSHGREMEVASWTWRRHVSRTSGKLMLTCTYYGTNMNRSVMEYLPVAHEGYAGQQAIRLLEDIAYKSGDPLFYIRYILREKPTESDKALVSIASDMNKRRPPDLIRYKKDGKFYHITERIWDELSERAGTSTN